jgi:hypothetical protein
MQTMGKKKDKKKQKSMAALEELAHRLYESNVDIAVHRAVILEALSIFIQRDEKHGQIWKTNTLEEGNLHITSKYKRFTSDPATHIDDGLDLINYVVFQIINVRSGRV